MKAHIRLLAAGVLAGSFPSAPLWAQTEGDFGILLMAHGGGPAWDAGVLEAVAPLEERYPLEVAFGMADAGSIEQAAKRLEERGVDDIAVVRLFISGESWYERTRQILGLSEGAPPASSRAAAAATAAQGAHAEHGGAADPGEHAGTAEPAGQRLLAANAEQAFDAEQASHPEHGSHEEQATHKGHVAHEDQASHEQLAAHEEQGSHEEQVSQQEHVAQDAHADPAAPGESSLAQAHTHSASTAAAASPTAGSGGAETSGGHGGHAMGFWRIDSAAAFHLSEEGLAEAPESGEVLLDRALALSVEPAGEDVLLLAHGPETEAENARWLAYMDGHGERLRQRGFHAVKVATLREDWPEERKLAEQDIRAFVAASGAAGRQVIVLPFRVHGFGPYAKVLEGLDYRADETGLIPHPAITRWIERQALALRGSSAGE